MPDMNGLFHFKTRGSKMKNNQINFKYISTVALRNAIPILQRLLPDGKIIGNHWVVRNPKRTDRNAGSFKINIRTGIWKDFADEQAKGGDLIALYAYLYDVSQVDAAKDIASMLNIKDACYE